MVGFFMGMVGQGGADSATQYIAATRTASPYAAVYKYNEIDDDFDILSSPFSAAIDVAAHYCAFSPGSLFLAFGIAASSGITSSRVVVYERADDTFTLLPDPGTLPPNGAVQSLDWKIIDGETYLLVGSDTTPFILVYRIDGIAGSYTLTKLANPGVLPASGARAFFGGERFITQYLTAAYWQISGGVFTTYSPTGITTPGGSPSPTAVRMRDDGEFITLSSNGTNSTFRTRLNYKSGVDAYSLATMALQNNGISVRGSVFAANDAGDEFLAFAKTGDAGSVTKRQIYRQSDATTYTSIYAAPASNQQCDDVFAAPDGRWFAFLENTGLFERPSMVEMLGGTSTSLLDDAAVSALFNAGLLTDPNCMAFGSYGI